MKFHKNPSSGGRVVPCGQTDGEAENVTKLTASFCNLGTRLKNQQWVVTAYYYYYIRISPWSKLSMSEYILVPGTHFFRQWYMEF
jgi:hypothetical protein